MNTDYFNRRKTIRHYSDAEISDSTLSALLAKAVQAPTLGGMQLYSVVVTRDIEMKKKLAPCHFNQPMITNAPVVLTFCADFNRFNKWCTVSNAEPCYENFQSFIGAMLDVTIFAQQFNTIAEMEGLGCCYIGTTTYNAPEIAKVLSLPKMVIPIATLTVGYPENYEKEPKAERLPLEAIVHNECYNDYSAHSVRALYAEKETLDINKKYVAENGKQSLAQVFTDIRYNRQNNEYFSQVFFDFIASQGFKCPF